MSAVPHTESFGTLNEERLFRKLAGRILPVLMLAYLAAYIDRINIGFAKLQMAQDLAFSDAVYGFGAGIFFLGYFLFEVPSNLILHRVGARRWITRIMITWGLVSGLTMLVRTPGEFYVMRFLLGVAEAGFIPGVIYHLSNWFPSQRRGRVMSVFYIALALSGFIGGPLSGLIMESMSGVGGLAGWRWTFLIEAIPSVLIGLLVFFTLEEKISDAAWLDQAERAHLTQLIAEDNRGKVRLSLRQLAANKTVAVMSLIFFCDVFAIYGLNFWMPTLIHNMGIQSNLTIGLVSALPSACAIVSMVFFGRSADRHRERRWHLVALFLLGATGMALSIAWQHNVILGVLALCVANMGILAIPPLFWSLPTAILGGAAAAAGIAWINSLANLSGFLGPYIVGYVKQASGSTDAAIYLLAAVLFIGAALVLTIPARMVNK